jgi:hypothetical protein
LRCESGEVRIFTGENPDFSGFSPVAGRQGAREGTSRYYYGVEYSTYVRTSAHEQQHKQPWRIVDQNQPIKKTAHHDDKVRDDDG